MSKVLAIEFWVLFDATTPEPYIKKMMPEGFLAFFDHEEDAIRAKSFHPGTDYKRVPYVRQSDHLAALSAVTAERDAANSRLHEVAVACAEAEAERDQLRAEVEALRKDATLGSAIQRACCDLPDGFMISVSLEKDAGTLELCLPDTDAVLDDFDGETFADQIHAAIDAAMAAKEA